MAEWPEWPADAAAWIRSRKESRDALFLGGVSSGIGDDEVALPNGLRRGSFEPPEAEVIEDAERTELGVFLAYGLGVVRVRGLKLCPTSESFVFVDVFHRGRPSAMLELDLGRRVARGVALPLRGGVVKLEELG